MNDEIRDAAIAYAEHGWYVIPLHGVNGDGTCTCWAGMECDSAGKHPLWRDWPEKASNDPEIVAAWWNEFQQPRNVGVVCGRSNLIVIDIDDEKGADWLNGLNGVVPGCPQVRTRRGVHLYLEGQVQAAKLAGLDVKAGNGFVVAPPSLRADGGRYEWV
ncbi:MAG: bifunctional DNA primase/polymerase [Opitutales bacterium]